MSENFEELFNRLASIWKSETKYISSVTQECTHPAFQKIIAMGMEVVPLLLCELEKEAHNWFWALKAITGEDPVDPQDRGKIELMRKAWLDWGEAKGYR